jgi:hypothetical protein
MDAEQGESEPDRCGKDDEPPWSICAMGKHKRHAERRSHEQQHPRIRLCPRRSVDDDPGDRGERQEDEEPAVVEGARAAGREAVRGQSPKLRQPPQTGRRRRSTPAIGSLAQPGHLRGTPLPLR